ncbi:unnamed protein product [Parnassius mnemosyne]|uniref:von Hippel-Lindau disease tumour suppressor beta domain-containing protein n=1 Tax=Parnassius mnemosyne TaxID=213953 RepID=A0AAV1L6X4_9NEOP
MAEVIENDLVYEIDDAGQRVLVRSTESIQRAYLRFTNKTSRQIDVWWRDFHGARRHYVRLDPGTYFDINTFITHPWEFTDVATKERYVINNKTIYRPPRNIGGMMYRTNWNITIGVRSLRRTALLFLALNLVDTCDVETLELPQVLTQELGQLIEILHQEPFLGLST